MNQIKQKEYLNEYFWKSSFSARFDSAVQDKLAADIKKMDEIIKNNKPKYGPEFKFPLEKEDLRWAPFDVGYSLCKAILSILASRVPKSFINNIPVVLDNSNLSRGTGKNYHHFFPKKFLELQKISNVKRNVISNITVISAADNQKEIKTQAPSKYITDFQKSNPELAETLTLHLIGDLQDFGILDDNYEKFIEERTNLIWKEIQSRIET